MVKIQCPILRSNKNENKTKLKMKNYDLQSNNPRWYKIYLEEINKCSKLLEARALEMTGGEE